MLADGIMQDPELVSVIIELPMPCSVKLLQLSWESFANQRKLYQNQILSKKFMSRTKLYGAESWRMTGSDLSVLRGFDYKCLRKILQIYWSNAISNKDLEKTTDILQTVKEIKRSRWMDGAYTTYKYSCPPKNLLHLDPGRWLSQRMT